MNKKAITAIALSLPLVATNTFAYEVNDYFRLGGLLAGAYQCQNVSDAPAFDNTCEGGALFQPEFSFLPTANDEIFFKLGFAEGNALNKTPPFIIPSWATSPLV